MSTIKVRRLPSGEELVPEGLVLDEEQSPSDADWRDPRQLLFERRSQALSSVDSKGRSQRAGSPSHPPNAD
jgi:hypothetical protein